MSDVNPQVYIVDDDAGFRKSLRLLLRSENLNVQAYASAHSFLAAYDPSMPGCMILDYRMPEMSGLELQQRLAELGAYLPIIMVTAHADVKTAVETMKLGSFDLIEKPYAAKHLLARITDALHHDQQARAERLWRLSLCERMAALSPREREVLILWIAGGTSKAIADSLGISVSTVDNHRARIIKKLQAETAADAVRIALAAEPDLMRSRTGQP